MTVITTVDNLNGPVAVGIVKTMLNEGANGIIDFNVLAVYQPAIAKLVKQAGIPADAIVGANLPDYPGGSRRAEAKKKFGTCYASRRAVAGPRSSCRGRRGRRRGRSAYTY